MITAQMIKEKAKELGAGVCGIGDIKYFIGDDPQHNPLSILPNATCIIGFGIPVPKGLFMAMDEQRQYFNYTNLAVKYTDETFAEIFLLKMGAMIEDAGYEAFVYRKTLITRRVIVIHRLGNSCFGGVVVIGITTLVCISHREAIIEIP